MFVRVGDRVVGGDPLLVNKRDPEVMYTAPGSGTVAAINRGARRVLKSVVIDLDDSEEAAAVPAKPATASIDDLRSTLLRSGLWTAFRTRPFSKVPHSESRPRSPCTRRRRGK